MLGDIDPIKAARRGQDIGDELTIHYGLLPRANRVSSPSMNCPTSPARFRSVVQRHAGRRHPDQGLSRAPAARRPARLHGQPEDYTARGKIITPLKDRIGSEIRTHYPAELEQGIAITEQEAWTTRDSPVAMAVPGYVREVVEQIAFLAREDKKIDKRSGVSQRLPISVLENVISNAERRALEAANPKPCRAWWTSMRRCLRSPASWSSSTKANSKAATTWRANWCARPSGACSPNTSTA
jgi:magnesium chelatase subunit I